MYLYLVIYVLILSIYIFKLTNKRIKIFTTNITNIFILSHLFTFLITPIMYNQLFMMSNFIWSSISIISLIAIIFASSVKVLRFNNSSRTLEMNKAKYFFIVFILVKLYQILANIGDSGINRTLIWLQNEMAGRRLLDIFLGTLGVLSLFYFSKLFIDKKKMYFIINYSLYLFATIFTSAH
jgi:hypothetical protein